MLVEPRPLDEVICVTPGICAKLRSSGWATEEAMVSALAPGSWADTWMVGKSTLRQRRDGQVLIGDDADEEDAHHDEGRRDRIADERCRDAAVHT